mmetsp:Transcript_17665/g.32923  ORF Transcript_17665/g.32923 Transcript_17665/m.32923 type:complete len:205 (+) Transcript_17665:317-931(+)
MPPKPFHNYYPFNSRNDPNLPPPRLLRPLLPLKLHRSPHVPNPPRRPPKLGPPPNKRPPFLLPHPPSGQLLLPKKVPPNRLLLPPLPQHLPLSFLSKQPKLLSSPNLLNRLNPLNLPPNRNLHNLNPHLQLPLLPLLHRPLVHNLKDPPRRPLRRIHLPRPRPPPQKIRQLQLLKKPKNVQMLQREHIRPRRTEKVPLERQGTP